MKRVVAMVAVVAGLGCGGSPPMVGRNDPCPARAAPDPPALELDRDAIFAGVCAVRHRIEACGARLQGRGTVKIRAVVLPSGMVEKLEVVETPGRRIATCVAIAVRNATFETTQLGGSFSYPFIFR